MKQTENKKVNFQIFKILNQKILKIHLDVVREWRHPVLVGVLGGVAGAGVRVRGVWDPAGSRGHSLVGAVCRVLNLGPGPILAAGAEIEIRDFQSFCVAASFLWQGTLAERKGSYS